jgi:hypothetical protein
MNYAIIRLYLLNCTLCCTYTNCFFVVNTSKNQLLVEVIAYKPSPTGVGFIPVKIIKKMLHPGDAIEQQSGHYKELGVNIHLGKEELLTPTEENKKLIRTTQYDLFRHFSARNAKPSLTERGVPDFIGQDHVFEITGDKYETDVTLLYDPDYKPVLHKQITTPMNKPAKKRLTLQKNTHDYQETRQVCAVQSK